MKRNFANEVTLTRRQTLESRTNKILEFLLLAIETPVRVAMKTIVKFMFSKKATKIDKIFTVDLTLCSNHQIDGEEFVNFRGLLRKYEL